MNPQRMERRISAAMDSGKTCLQALSSELPARQSLFAAPGFAPSNAGGKAAPRMAMRSTDTLKPHPSLLKENLWPTPERLLALEKLGEAIFEQPLLITKENLIVDGYARWRIARRQQRATLLCIEFPLTEREALQRILQTHCRPEWLNDFTRVQLALDLEPWFRAQAQANQSTGGKEKASSKLTEDRRLDCRKQIATLAGVSTGNVTKVKQILRSVGVRQLSEALRSGEISVHRGFALSKLSFAEQQSALGNLRIKKRTNERITKLLAKNISKCDPVTDSLRYLRLGLEGLKNMPWMASHWRQFEDLIAVIEHQFQTERGFSDARQTDNQADTGRESGTLGQRTNKTSGPRRVPESAQLSNLSAGG